MDLSAMTVQLETGLVISPVSPGTRITLSIGVGTSTATTQLITTWCRFQADSQQLVDTRVVVAIRMDVHNA